MPRFRLLQARLPGDPVRDEERRSFALRLGVHESAILCHDLLSETTQLSSVTEDVDAVLVGGSGAFSIYDEEPWLPPFIDTLGELAAADVPMFASCFGFQGLVVALGGTVERDEPNAEVGTYELEITDAAAADPVFRDLPTRFPAQLGHKDRAYDLPGDAVLLASSPRCPYQAFRLGEHIYATQFHPELTHEDNRGRFARYFDDYSRVFGKSEAQDLLDSFRPSPDADRLLARFLDLPWNR